MTSLFRRGLVPLVFSVALLVAVLPIPEVFATTTLVQGPKTANCVSGASCATGNFVSSVVSGNTIIVAIADNWLTNDCSVTYTLSDTLGTSFTKIAQATCDPNFSNNGAASGNAFIFAGNLTSSGTDSVTATPSKTINFAVTVMAYEVSGLGTRKQSATGTCTSSCTGETGIQTNTSIIFLSNNFLVTATNMNVVSEAPGPGFSAARASPNSRNSEYSVPGVNSPTNFPWSVSVGADNGHFTEVGVVWDFGGAPKVVACNWFQLQCWWYPFFFFMAYACFVIPIARVGGLDRRDFGWVFLDGFALSSLIAVIMGMISIMVPMILVGVGMLVAIRS